MKLRLDSADRRRDRGLSRPLAEDAARGPAARRLAEVAGQARPVGDVRRATIRRRRARTPSSRAMRVQYRRQRDGDAALADAKPLWFTGQNTPDACEPLFAALIAKRRPVGRRPSRALPPRDRSRQRSPRAIDRRRPAARRSDHARGNSRTSTRTRRRRLRKGEFRWKHRAGSDLALYALERAARTDAAGVRAAWEKQRGRLARSRSALRQCADRVPRGAAAESAGRTSGSARPASAALTDAQRAWRVRAALRAGAWPDVLAAIDAMPPSEQEESAWRYWKARALVGDGPRGRGVRALRRPRRRDQLLRDARRPRRSGSGRSSRASRSEPIAEALAAFGASAGVRRAVKLAQLDMRPESQREWLYVVRGLPDDALLLAAEYARREGLYDRAINTAERTSTRHDFGLRYLMPFREQFAAAAQEQRGRRGAAVRHRAPGIALRRRTSCPRRARSGSCS